MSENEQRVIFSRNLNRILDQTGKTQREVAEAIDVPATTLNTWCTGVALPRMGKVQKLADYFGIKKSDLLEDRSDGYYLNEKTAEMAQEIFENKELSLLFDVARKATPEQLKLLHDLALSWKKDE